MLREEIKNIETGNKKLREFGLLVGGVLGLFACLFWWREKPFYPYLFAVSLALIFCGALLPRVLKPIYVAWMTAALLIGWVMSRVLLSLVFYLIVTPIGFLARLMGKDFLDLKFKDDKESYWIPRESLSKLTQSDFEKQF